MIKYLIYDTETTGLNIVEDKPFLYTYGLVDDKLNLVSKSIFRTNDKEGRKKFQHYLTTVPVIVGHNIKFDIHMAINDGFTLKDFESKNFIDTAVLARLVINHDEQTDKTFSIALKKLATRYLHKDASASERELKTTLSNLTMAHKHEMKEYITKKKLWPENLKTREETILLNNLYNKWMEFFDQEPYCKLAQARKEFLLAHPAPTYADCPNVEPYALEDIDFTYGLFRLWYPLIGPKKQTITLKRISKAILPLLLMERQGLTIDLNKLLSDRKKLLDEISITKIIDPRNQKEIKIGQHAKLKELYEYETGMLLNSADKQTRKEIEGKSKAAQTANYLAKLVKYLTTYTTGILNKLANGIEPNQKEYKIYTQYNLAGTVTGRLSSNFQQFPKEPLVLKDGSEINIRSWFVTPKDYKYMFYFDYSQMELRLQCEWTNIVNGAPDINLARAFSPYKCIKQNGTYYLEEDPTHEWHPMDLHGQTTKHAFPNIDETHFSWDHYRSLGKRANFACNYGASAPKIQQALNVDFSVAQALVKGYKETFKGVVQFGKWISRRAYVTESIPNLLLRRYYSRNKHLLQNWLIQGSGADILLDKLASIYNYIQNKPHWKFMITVHDEIGLVCKDIPKEILVQEVSEIQKRMEHKLTAVDIITDVEYTTTSWADHKEWKGYDSV